MAACGGVRLVMSYLGLYTIFVHFNAVVNEPSILYPPTCNAHTVAIVVQDYCARYAPPPTLILYAIHHTILVMAILCKGQKAYQLAMWTSRPQASASAGGGGGEPVCVCVCVCVCVGVCVVYVRLVGMRCLCASV